MKRLVLVGAGHAHARVLREFASRAPRDAEIVLASSVVQAPYSGMMPGWLAGHYRWEDCTIDFGRLAQAAGARLVRADACGLDPDRRELTLEDGTRLDYDLLSLNVGSTLRPPALPGSIVLPLRPLACLRERWRDWCAALPSLPNRPLRIAMVGGGAAGVEMLLAAQWRLARIAPTREFQFALYTRSDRLLPAAPPDVSARLSALCAARGIELHYNQSVDAGGHALDRTPDLIFWAAGAQAVSWLRSTRLAADAHGFIEIDPALRSTSHSNVFAVGDCAGWKTPLPKAGVYSVRMGPVLAANLRNAAESRPLRAYRPQARFLALISAGDRRAVASWGPFSFSGEWVWRWKDWIDRRFIQRYALDQAPPGCRDARRRPGDPPLQRRQRKRTAGTATNVKTPMRNDAAALNVGNC